MIKFEHVKSNKGFIVEEINAKMLHNIPDSGLENIATPDVEAAEKSNDAIKKVVKKKMKKYEKDALEVKGKDYVVNPNTFKESMKIKDRKELAEFVSKLRENKIKRRIIPLHEDVDGYKYEVRYEKALNESDSDAQKSLEDCQKWIDYDMKHYGKISANTNDIIRKAGYQIIKDDRGDYEVTVGKYESLNEDKEEEVEIKDEIEVKEEPKIEEPKLETFDEQMDFLAKDEQEAIDGYHKVLDLVDDEHVKEQLEKILVEEEAHKAFLEAVKEDKSLVYSHEEEHEEVKNEIEDEVKVDLDDEEVEDDFEYDDDIIIPEDLKESLEVKTSSNIWNFGDEE